jgi:SAM-dependent methyltransferase
VRERAGRVRLVRADGEGLPFRDGCFDVVIAEAVAYAAPLAPFLAEARRVLRVGGRLGLVDIGRAPGAAVPIERFREALDEPRLNLLTAGEWHEVLARASYDPVRVDAFPIRLELETVAAELGDWARSLPRQLAELARDPAARRSFVTNYRVGFARGIEGVLAVATRR